MIRQLPSLLFTAAAPLAEHVPWIEDFTESSRRR